MSGELFGLSSGPRTAYTPGSGSQGDDTGTGTDAASNIAAKIVKTLLGGGALPDLGDDPFGKLEQLLGLRWAQMDGFEDGQLALTDRVDLLSALEDRGSCYAAGSGALINTGRVPFNSPVGPMQGVRLESGGWTLLAPGAWDIEARLAFSWTVGGGGQVWQVRTYRPNGTLFSVQTDADTNNGENTRGISTTVVVPDVGYRVEVWITTLVIGRSTFGGPDNNRFTVKHITNSVVNPI